MTQGMQSYPTERFDNIHASAAMLAKSPLGGTLKQFGKGRSPLMSVLHSDQGEIRLNKKKKSW